MTLEPDVLENDLSESQQAVAEAVNANMTTGITGGPTQIDELPVEEIYKEIDGEEEPDINMNVRYKVTTPTFETEWRIVVETFNAEY